MRSTSNSRRRLLTGAALLSTIAGLHSAPVLAQEDTEEAVQDKIVVTGRRVSQVDLAIGQDQASNTIAVTREELLSAPGGISGLKMLETLPGFNVQTDGALGLYEFGNSVTVRAFNLQQIGFVLDGVPMGRSDAFGGSPIFRYVDNENLGSVVASPGAGDVSKPSYASLGPIVSYNTIDPSEEAGGVIAYTLGDDNLNRSFLKLETGKIGGFSAYVSRSKTDSELWRGEGTIDREHIEGKMQYEFSPGTVLSAQYVHNDFFDFDSPNAPIATFEAQGNDYGYLGHVPEGCIVPVEVDFDRDGDIDGDDFTPVYTGGPCTRYNEDRVNIRDDTLYSATLDSVLTEGLTFSATVYREDKDGYGVSPDSYSNSKRISDRQAALGLDVTHPRGVQYGLSTVGGDRTGALAGLEWEIGNHLIAVGGWFEDETYNRTQIRLNNTEGAADGMVLWDEVAYFRRDYTSTRETMQFYVKDTMSLMDDKLKIDAGFKALKIDYELSGYRDYADYEVYGPQTVGTEYEELFLPMLGVVYSLNDTDQLFSSYSNNFALPRGADSIFSRAVQGPLPAPDGETADNFEIGFRTNRPQFNGSVAAFYTKFDNRLVVDSVLNPATEQNETFHVNAGSTTAYGLEFSGVYQPAFLNDMLYANANVTWNVAELDGDIPGPVIDGSPLNKAGNRLADSPEWIVTGGLTFEPTTWFVANLSAKYTDERFTNFGNTETLEAYTVVSGYMDIGGENDFGAPENISLRFNIDNIFDEETLPFTFTTTGTRGFVRPLNPRTFSATLTATF